MYSFKASTVDSLAALLEGRNVDRRVRLVLKMIARTMTSGVSIGDASLNSDPIAVTKYGLRR